MIFYKNNAKFTSFMMQDIFENQKDWINKLLKKYKQLKGQSMNNSTYRTYNIESIKDEFFNIGLSKEAIDFVFLHNDNYNFEFLKEKIIDVEKNLRRDISNLDIKIDAVRKKCKY